MEPVQAANHPPSCSRCHGCGWQEGTRQIPHRDVRGKVIRTYTRPEPCTNHWRDDEPDPHDSVPYERGIVIAWHAYADECRKLGKEPDHARFEGLLGAYLETR